MILVNGNEVINDVKLNQDGQFETTVVSFDPLECDHVEIIDRNRFVDNEIPFIDYPTYVHVNNERYDTSRYCVTEIGNVDDVICEIGYIKIGNSQKEIKPIKIDNIIIDELIIKTRAYKGAYSYGLSYSEYTELTFHYIFNIRIWDGKSEYQNYTFEADCKSRLNHSYDKRCYIISPIMTLCRRIIPLLNNYINMRKSLKHLNFLYLNCLLPQKSTIRYNVHPFQFEDALDIVYQSKVKQDADHITIEVGKEQDPYMNVYIVGLINSILNVNLELNKESNTYMADLPIDFQYPKELISLQNYLHCILFLGIYDNFDTEKSKEDYLTLPSAQYHNYVVLKNDYLNNLPSVDFLGFFDFIADMETTHFIDGLSRVGRDDYEWKEKSFSIPFKKNYQTSEKIISKINELLGVKLEFQEEKVSDYSSSSHPARYYYEEEYDSGYIAGAACSRNDIGSAKLKQESFYKLIDYFIKNKQEFGF